MRCTILKSTESHHSTPRLVLTLNLHHEDKLCDAAIKQQTCISLLVMKTINELRTSNDLPCIIIYISLSHVHKSWDEISVLMGYGIAHNINKFREGAGVRLTRLPADTKLWVDAASRAARWRWWQGWWDYQQLSMWHVTRDTVTLLIRDTHTRVLWCREARFSDYWWDIQMEANCILILMIRLAGIV